MKDKAYKGIDYFRFIAAILVIAIHTFPLLSVNTGADLILTRIIGRVAVPFFFMTTGFFVFSSYDEGSFSYKNFSLKIAKLYSVSILLYLPLNLYAGHFSGKYVGASILRNIFFNGTFYHLWYFPAIIIGAGVFLLLLKHCKIHTAIIVALLLYLIGVFGDSYYGIANEIPLLRSFYDILFFFFDYTRNGLFFSPIYLFLGALFSKTPQRHSFKTSMVGLLLSLSVLIVEGLLLHHFSAPRHDSMYIALLPSMYFLFQMLLLWKGRSQKSLRRIAMLIYVIHPWCIVLIRGFARLTKTEAFFVENSILHFIGVAFLSVFISIIVNFIWNKEKKSSDQKGRAWLEIDLSNLKHNFLQLKELLPKGCQVMAVVKADAYGHGDLQIAYELQKMGANAFAVASLEEGIRLRKSGIKGCILILGYTYPEEVGRVVKYDLTQTVVDYHYATVLNQYGKKVRVHIKIDTGMNRLGENFRHIDEITKIFQLRNLAIEGAYTHLCVADSQMKKDAVFTRQQVENFYKVVDHLKGLGYSSLKLHIQSSYGVLNYPEISCDYARLGIALYGLLSNERDETKAKVKLRPVLSIKARISIIKTLEASETIGYGRQFVVNAPMKIATVTLGYADGIPRNLTCGHVLLRGIKVPIIGRICMDQLTIDVTNIPNVEQGDIITIIGEEGKEKITAEEVAGQAVTITNELVSRLGSRLEKIYVEKTSSNKLEHRRIEEKKPSILHLESYT
ncbi:serine racemase VanT catalytic subunit [Clostridium aceticum]|nr:serine racemase VanT catalytic subunit [Clostridium aceticum]